MNVLVINAGSSSLKYQLLDMPEGRLLAKGLCERIGIDGKYKYEAAKGKFSGEYPMENHNDAIRFLTTMLTDKEHGVIKSMDEIQAVGHRVVTAGEKYDRSVLITDESLGAIEECSPLAPLHNPANLTGITACAEVMPGVPQVAVFDTAFHAKMPEHAYMYALPYEYYEKYGIRRYGFHGTSHKYVSRQCAEIMGRPIEELKIITCHMGNGSSIAAVKNGVSVDTSMGFTPLEGLPMGTRSGSIDPAIAEFVCEKEGITAKEFVSVLNKKSGLIGVSGVSSDLRDVKQAGKDGNKRAQLAYDILVYNIKKYIGAYAAAMGGADAIVFTAGIGENDNFTRYRVLSDMEYMGVCLNEEINQDDGEAQREITGKGGTVRVFVIPTNEEVVIAQDTVDIVGR